MEFLKVCETIGIPSVFVIASWCVGHCIRISKKVNILMKAQQAQMRGQLIDLYHKYVDEFNEKGYIYEIQLQEWMNQYDAYHELAANGVLDERRRQLLLLPTKK